MRILFLTNSRFPPREGIGHHVLALARALRAHGCRVLVLARGTGADWQEGELEGIPFRLFPYPRLKPFHHLLLRPGLQRWLDRHAGAADLLHLHLPLLPPLATELPVAVTVHTPMLADTAAVREGLLQAPAMRLHARLFSRHYEQAWLDRADLLFCVSAQVGRELARHYRLRGRMPEVLPNGVDPKRFAYRPLAGRENVVLYVGRLGPRKGLYRLLDAFARLPRGRNRLVLLGEGPLARPLRRRARRLGIEPEVSFLGAGDHQQVLHWLHRAGCFVHPSDYEGFPLVLLEAMAAGAPVVTTPIGALEELGPEPPLRVAAPEVPALAEAIGETLADVEGSQRRAAAARLLVVDRFDWRRIALRLLVHYERLFRRAA